MGFEPKRPASDLSRFVVEEAGFRLPALAQKLLEDASRRVADDGGVLPRHGATDGRGAAVAGDANRLGHGRSVGESGTETSDGLDENVVISGLRVPRVGDAAHGRLHQSHDADRHRRGRFGDSVQLPVMRRLRGIEARDDVAVGVEEALAADVQDGQKLAGERVGPVLAEGARTDGDGNRSPGPGGEAVVGGEDRLRHRGRERGREQPGAP